MKPNRPILLVLPLLLPPFLSPAMGGTVQEGALATEAEAAPIGLQVRLDRLTEDLEAGRVASNVSGMAIAVVRGDEVIYAKGFGLADRATERPATPETLFAIGSCTKAFTSTVIGALVDEGKMDWDDPVTKYLPDFKLAVDAKDSSEAVVTLRDLLAHRTGFTRMCVLWAAGKADRSTILKTATQAEPWSPFRKAFFYNNVMFLAAGEASAVAAETGWDQLLEERILDPLGMSASGSRYAQAQADEALALGYTWLKESETLKRLPMRPLDSIGPAGSINSTVTDMAQWVRLLLGGGTIDGKQIVSQESLTETWEPQMRVGGDKQYGLGWMLGEWNGRREVEHGGNIDGFSAMVALLPEEDLGFVLLMNASAPPLQGTCRSMVWKALLGDVPSATEASLQEGVADFSRFLGTYIANYAHFDNEEFVVKVVNNRLAIDIPSQTLYELDAPDKEGKRAFSAVPSIQAVFHEGPGGEVSILTLHQHGLAFDIPRQGFTPEPDGSEEEFRKYYGSYAHPLLPRPFKVYYRGGRVVCDIPGQTVFELRPPGEEGIWYFRATDMLGLEFHEEDDGSIMSLTLHERGTEIECEQLESSPSELPTLAEVMALRGGKVASQKLQELGAMRMTGELRMVHAGIQGTTVATFQGTDRIRNENDMGPFGWDHSVSNRDRAWTASAFAPYEELEGDIADQVALSHPGVFLGDWSLYFDKVQVARMDRHKGTELIVVRLKRGELPAWEAFIDASTGNLLRLDAKVILPGLGTVSQTIELDDYRELFGLSWPHRIATENPMSGRVEITYKKIEAGISVPSGFYDPE